MLKHKGEIYSAEREEGQTNFREKMRFWKANLDVVQENGWGKDLKDFRHGFSDTQFSRLLSCLLFLWNCQIQSKTAVTLSFPAILALQWMQS